MSGCDARQASFNRQAILNESNVLRRLDHPSIPRLIESFEVDDYAFVIYEYIGGKDLRRHLQGLPSGHFDQKQMICWGSILCGVMEYLNTPMPDRPFPIVHWSIQPANIMPCDDGSLKLIDFSVSCELKPDNCRSGLRVGVPGYSAPEQVEEMAHASFPVDQRADIYALGTTLYTLLTGHTPSKTAPDSPVSFEFISFGSSTQSSREA